MALIFDSDAYSRKSRRHGTSGRRRTTTSYDKYGYQVATLGSSSYSESVMHVLRVRPGVVVNFIEPPSRSSRSNRPRTSSHHVEHRSSHKSSRPHDTDDEISSSWEMTHSPHPRSLELFDEGVLSNPLRFVETEPPPQEQLPIVRRPTPAHPSPHFATEAHYPPPSHDPLPMVRRSTPSPPSHHFAPEPQHSTQLYESHREQSSPIDIPIHSRPPSSDSDFAHHSPSTLSSISDSPPTHHDHALQPYYYAPRHTRPDPIDIPVQNSSGRNLSRSFDYPSHRMHSSDSSSPPSATRTVRFNDDPVQRSPSPRRKGWWNRRGDQLWDNDGAYAPAADHDKYPPDLENYPEPGVGWMNEDGMQIDTKRRIVRKKPLRSALKKTSSSV